MKRLIRYFTVLCIIALILSGCSPETDASEAVEETIQGPGTITTAPDATLELAPTGTPRPSPVPISTPEPGLVQSYEPLYPEDVENIIGCTMSVDQANDMFGEPLSGFGYNYAGEYTCICIDYENAYIELSGLPLELVEQDNPDILQDMTDEDSKAQLEVALLWIKNDPGGRFRIRGAGIGSSCWQVLAAFLNLSENYTDKDFIGRTTLYTLADMYGGNHEDSSDILGGYIIKYEPSLVYTATKVDDTIAYRYKTVSPWKIQYAFIYDYDETEDTDSCKCGIVEFFIRRNVVVGMQISNTVY